MDRWRYLARDHPHIHGEHETGLTADEVNKGSPPYTWGALIIVVLVDFAVGITPIYMGSTSTLLINDRPLKDHPHIHGEHAAIALFRRASQGSPPYTWGAHPIQFIDQRLNRITPIYMGSTLGTFRTKNVT